MASKSMFIPTGMEGSDSEGLESDDEDVKDVKGKGKASGDGKKKEKKTRSSKACDNCRKAKCKCLRVTQPGQTEPGPCSNCLATGADCTFQGATRKRGPPKGYIEAIESRLHRMEALLGGLLQNDDPRAQTLLGELIGDDDARDMLTRDLREAVANQSQSKQPRKSWKKELETPSAIPTVSLPSQSQPVVARGFSSSTAISEAQPFVNNPTPRWFSEDDLSVTPILESFNGATASPFSLPPNSLGLDPSLSQQYRTPGSLGGGMDDSDDDRKGVLGIDIPMPTAFDLSGANHLDHSSHSSTFPLPASQHVPVEPIQPTPTVGSPRQRRKLNTAGASPADGKEPAAKAFSFQPPVKTNLPPNAINHTGQASYSLSADAELSPGAEQEDGQGMTELADVVGQLSLNENAEVRYHGRSSGLYLISKSARYKDFFWQFPSAGVWPAADGQVHKTEKEILQITESEDPLPDRQTQQHLLDLYWCYVHPHFPILYKVSFMRQYRHSLNNPDSTEPSTPAGAGKVPIVLLLSMFALAARYSNLEPHKNDGKYWPAGQEYLDKARRVLNYDYGSSKLVSVQALLLMAYREIGTGAMSASWLYTGMGIRMAQDLGLFRDVEKWFLPVQRFSHEEKQTRKRVWWGCVIMDRYTSSYIGRPGTIHERDYDTSFPSEDEPDEHEQWKPLRADGTEWSSVAKGATTDADAQRAVALARYPPTKMHTMSCFNAAGALAVIINRIIANVYAIRVRVLGQSSETLLSLLDQSLASWYLALPPHLAYNPAGKKVPPPHVLSLHLQFYSALILLHRPFIPGQNSASSPTHFPSHSICTTSANAIANIVTTFSKTFSLRQCPPFLTYPIFSAAVICVYNAGFDEALARPAKAHLMQCMSALKEMETIWGSAMRQWELLQGLVDLRDAELGAELQGLQDRGTKRPAESENSPMPPVSFSNIRPANFHARPLGKSKSRRKGSATPAAAPTPAPPVAQPIPGPSDQLSEMPPIDPNLFLDTLSQPLFPAPPVSVPGFEGGHQSYDIINGTDDTTQFQLPHGDFHEMLQTFLGPIEAASGLAQAANNLPEHMGGDFQSAFYGIPIGADGQQWLDYSQHAFGSSSMSPESGGSNHA
ncbi:hypothetical protein T439DRAFT_377335 [Meredithblackwellia eburnea MCA 4105]